MNIETNEETRKRRMKMRQDEYECPHCGGDITLLHRVVATHGSIRKMKRKLKAAVPKVDPRISRIERLLQDLKGGAKKAAGEPTWPKAAPAPSDAEKARHARLVAAGRLGARVRWANARKLRALKAQESVAQVVSEEAPTSMVKVQVAPTKAKGGAFCGYPGCHFRPNEMRHYHRADVKIGEKGSPSLSPNAAKGIAAIRQKAREQRALLQAAEGRSNV